MSFTFVDGFENYHRATDSLDRLDPRSLQHDGTYAIALTRALANSDLDHVLGPPRVYFDFVLATRRRLFAFLRDRVDPCRLRALRGGGGAGLGVAAWSRLLAWRRATEHGTFWHAL